VEAQCCHLKNSSFNPSNMFENSKVLLTLVLDDIHDSNENEDDDDHELQ